MSITIEKINGKLMTVVWHDGVEDNAFIYSACDEVRLSTGIIEYTFLESTRKGCKFTRHIATALPALPRTLMPDHESLVAAYISMGLKPACTKDDCNNAIIGCYIENGAWIKQNGTVPWYFPYITHAIYNGEMVDIAIEDE